MDHVTKGIALLDALHARMDKGEARAPFNEIGVIIALLKGEYDPDTESEPAGVVLPQPIERVTLTSPTDTTFPITVIPPREGSEFDTLALWGNDENLVSVDRAQAAMLRDVFDRWLGHDRVALDARERAAIRAGLFQYWAQATSGWPDEGGEADMLTELNGEKPLDADEAIALAKKMNPNRVYPTS